MVGGSKRALEIVTPILKCYCADIHHLGEEPGSGQHAKVSNQIVCCLNALAVVEGLVYGHKAGLDINQLSSIISKGTGGSFILNYFSQKLN